MRKAHVLRIALFAFVIAAAALRAAQQPTQPSSPPATQPVPGATKSTVVWVNTTTGFYHQPDSRYYGKTKHGKYMPQADAIKAGYRPAKD